MEKYEKIKELIENGIQESGSIILKVSKKIYPKWCEGDTLKPLLTIKKMDKDILCEYLYLSKFQLYSVEHLFEEDENIRTVEKRISSYFIDNTLGYGYFNMLLGSLITYIQAPVNRIEYIEHRTYYTVKLNMDDIKGFFMAVINIVRSEETEKYLYGYEHYILCNYKKWILDICERYDYDVPIEVITSLDHSIVRKTEEYVK